MPDIIHERRNNQPVHRVSTRMLTRRIIFTITAAVSVLTIIGLVWALRPIVLPFIIGTLVAYICFPLLKLFTRRGIPRGASILLLFAVFFAAVTLIVNQLGSIIPDERDSLVLRTRFQYKLNERYKAYMGIDVPGQKGTMIYQYLGPDLDNFMANINTMLRLNKDDQELFLKYREGYKGLPPIKDQYFEYFKKNIEKYPAIEEHPAAAEQEKTDVAVDADHPAQSHLSSMMAAIKIWIITPLVFLFLLIDNGEIKRFFIGLVPNRYFEVSLAVFDKVNRAIGNYLRGIMIECSLVAGAYVLLFTLIGFEIKMAVMIGVFAGIANAIPLLGLGIAMVSGAAYALIAENVTSLLPFITGDNMILAVAVCVLIVMMLDNGIFQPFVVGGAVQIHPLAVFVGIIGGSMMFGFAGLILAIPTIVVVKETVFTLFSELKDYYII
jgi:predicted PurR-regulated permease PerM